MATSRPGDQQRAERRSFWASLRIALAGAAYTLRTERNARIQLVIGGGALLLGLILRISAVEWAILLLLFFLVLALESLNTAVEAVVDLVTDDHHELAKVAKDTAAGAVVLMAMGSIGVGIAIFGPRLWALFF